MDPGLDRQIGPASVQQLTLTHGVTCDVFAQPVDQGRLKINHAIAQFPFRRQLIVQRFRMLTEKIRVLCEICGHLCRRDLPAVIRFGRILGHATLEDRLAGFLPVGQERLESLVSKRVIEQSQEDVRR